MMHKIKGFFGSPETSEYLAKISRTLRARARAMAYASYASVHSLVPKKAYKHWMLLFKEGQFSAPPSLSLPKDHWGMMSEQSNIIQKIPLFISEEGVNCLEGHSKMRCSFEIRRNMWMVNKKTIWIYAVTAGYF